MMVIQRQFHICDKVGLTSGYAENFLYSTPFEEDYIENFWGNTPTHTEGKKTRVFFTTAAQVPTTRLAAIL